MAKYARSVRRLRGRDHPLAARDYAATALGSSSSSALKRAGRSSIGTWPVSSKITLREPGISRSYSSASVDRDDLVVLRPRRSASGSCDLRQAVAEVVVERSR